MKLPSVFIPAAVIVFAALCVPLREAFVYPAARVTFAEPGAAEGAVVRTAEMIVQGVKCKGTAEFFLSRYEAQEGILDLEAYAADHKVIVTYDALKIDTEKIRIIGEAPIRTRSGELRQFFVVEKVTERQAGENE
jgi:hypothetical protein